MQTKINVLYICNDGVRIEGSALSLLYLVESVKEWVNPIFLVSCEGDVSHKIRELGYTCIINRFAFMWLNSKFNNYYRLKLYIRDLIDARVLKHKLNGVKIDIVHSNSSINVIGMVLSKMLHAKHVWHVREFFDLDFQLDVLGGLPSLNRKLNTADARIAITQKIKEVRGLKDENTFVYWDAVRRSSDVTPIAAKEKYFLFCSAHLSLTKGAVFAVDCFAKSGLMAQGYHLKMIGSTDNTVVMNKIIDTANKYNCLNSIEFLGYQKDIQPYFQHATAFLMCSIFEALGRVTVESMFYGCPVIGRNTGGTAEIVKPGISGYLFNNDEECIELMKRIAEEDQTILEKSAQQYAVNNFSTECYGPEIMKVYHTVLKISD